MTLIVSCTDNYDKLIFEVNEPVIVIEGLITNDSPPYYIKVSTTTSFNDSIASKKIIDATVILCKDSIQTEELIMTEPGIYEVNTITGEIGSTYYLEVNYENQSYSANTQMLPLPIIDSLSYKYYNEDNMEKGYYITLYMTRLNSDAISYFKINTYKSTKDNKEENFYIFSDHYLDYVWAEIPNAYKVGDTVIIELQSLAKEIFEYYFDLLVISSYYTYPSYYSSNPKSNISNNALGIFQVSALVSDTIIIR